MKSVVALLALAGGVSAWYGNTTTYVAAPERSTCEHWGKLTMGQILHEI